MVVVVASCAGGGTLVGGDGRSGREPCRRGDIDGGRWSQWSRVMQEGRHWWGEMVVVVASMREGRCWWGEMVVVVASKHARPCCRPPHCCCCSRSCPLRCLALALFIVSLLPSSLSCYRPSSLSLSLLLMSSLLWHWPWALCHCHRVNAGQGGGGGVAITIVVSLVVSVPLVVPHCCCCCCPPPPRCCLIVVVVSMQGRVVVVESPSSSCPSPHHHHPPPPPHCRCRCGIGHAQSCHRLWLHHVSCACGRASMGGKGGWWWWLHACRRVSGEHLVRGCWGWWVQVSGHVGVW